MRPAEPVVQRYVPAVNVVVCLSLAVFAGTGCVPRYRPPRSDEPHAVLKLRRNYEQTAGTSLVERVDIDEHRAYEQSSPAQLGRDARTDAILVHPTPATATVSSGFFHMEMKRVQERYSDQVPEYYTERYDCSSGFGTNRTYRTCSRQATRYRTEYKTRWVTKQIEVDDGACQRSVALSPKPGGVYLLVYTYQDRGVCTLSCFEQETSAPGTFSNRPCAAAVSAK